MNKSLYITHQGSTVGKYRELLMDQINIVLIGFRYNKLADRISSTLAENESLHLCGEFDSIDDFVRVCPEEKSAIILIDLNRYSSDSVEQIKRICSSYSNCKLLPVSEERDIDFVRTILNQGTSGYMWQHELADELPMIIRNLDKGRSVLSKSIVQGLFKN